MKEDLLMIFMKIPRRGEVKTRLAKTIGDKRAVEVYKKLLAHTYLTARKVESCDKRVLWGNDPGDTNSQYIPDDFQGESQADGDLGNRLYDAFSNAFSNDYKRTIVIGSDSLEVKALHIRAAYHALHTVDVCIGPATDGGYYLLGTNTFIPSLFENKSWSTDKVCAQTIKEIERLGLSYQLLPTLSDIDYEEDLVKHDL